MSTRTKGGVTSLSTTAAMPLPLLIALEANIGAGKTTQMERLKALLGGLDRVVVLTEPVDEWVEKGFLDVMYGNPQNPWLLCSFQHMVLMSLAGDLLKALARRPAPAIIVTERSPFSNYDIFGKANLADAPLDMYHHTWERILGGLPSKLQPFFVHLSTQVDTIVGRMATRGRAAESNVPRAYLEMLDENHAGFLCQTRHAVIDGNRDEDAVWRDLCSVLGRCFDEAGRAFGEAAREADPTEEGELTAMARAAREGADALGVARAR